MAPRRGRDRLPPLWLRRHTGPVARFESAARETAEFLDRPRPRAPGRYRRGHRLRRGRHGPRSSRAASARRAATSGSTCTRHRSTGAASATRPMPDCPSRSRKSPRCTARPRARPRRASDFRSRTRRPISCSPSPSSRTCWPEAAHYLAETRRVPEARKRRGRHGVPVRREPRRAGAGSPRVSLRRLRHPLASAGTADRRGRLRAVRVRRAGPGSGPARPVDVARILPRLRERDRSGHAPARHMSGRR